MKLDDLIPSSTRLLCGRYFRPEQHGSLILNPAWLRDNNRQIWTLRKWGKEGGKLLADGGLEPRQGMLLMTPPNQGVMAETIDADEELFWIWAEQVLAEITPEEEEDAE